MLNHKLFIQKLNFNFIILSRLFICGSIFCFLTTNLYSQETNIFSTDNQDNKKENKEENQNITNLESFKSYLAQKELSGGKKFNITEVKNVDINQDGNPDWLIFFSDKRRVYLDLLLAGPVDSLTQTVLQYHHVSVPSGDFYEYIASKNEIKVGEYTYPDYSLRGSDLLLWYDFYQVKGNSLEKVNHHYLSFYRKMREKYKKRIAVLRAEYVENKKKLRKKPDIILDLSNNLKIDHIKRYQLFIKKILEIYAGRG